MVTASGMQNMVQHRKENTYFVTNNFFCLLFLLLGLSTSSAPVEGPSVDLGSSIEAIWNFFKDSQAELHRNIVPRWSNEASPFPSIIPTSDPK